MGTIRENCLICGNNTFIQDTSIKGDKFVDEISTLCTSCGLVFIQNYAIDEEYYIEGKFDSEIRKNLERSKKRSNLLAKGRINVLENFFKNSSSYLEIGSGVGAMLEIASMYMPKESIIGVEPSPGAASISIENGYNVYVKNFDKDMFSRTFDCVGLFHVIEHLEDPFKMFFDISYILNPGGYLLLEYPDLEQALKRSHFSRNTYFQKSHLFDFSLCHIIYLAEMSDLSPIVILKHKPSDYPTDKNVLCVFKKSDGGPVEKKWLEHGATMLLKLREKNLFLS